MYPELPLSNWSVRKALDSLPDSFAKAKFRIIYTILLFSVVKALIVSSFAIASDQWLQLIRAFAGIFLYILLFKMMFTFPSRIKLFAHIMLIAGLIMIWTNALVFIHRMNLPVVQFAFMIVLCSFYILGTRAGFVYSIMALLPFVMYVFIPDGFGFTKSTEQLASPGFEIISALNFLTIIMAHYYFYKAFQDNIKEKEKLNVQLQATAAEAKDLAQSRADFLATMTHELRTPLNSVVGVTELLLQDKPEERHKENLDILRYSASDLLSLINNILDVNKLDSKKVQLENTPVDLYQLLNNVCSVLKIKARDKQVNLVLEIDKKLEDLTVISDSTRLLQVMYNLVGNAIKFTENGTVTVSLNLVETGGNKAQIMFSVADTGIGISPDKQKIIFEMFSQAEPETTRKYGGTGLGLTIVQQVLTLFNSSIQLESTPGKGSRFYFRIKFDTVEKEAAKKGHEQTTDLKGMTILVAEDNDINKLVLQKQLHNLGINAVMVADGKQAYEKWLAGTYDVVFLDLDMPGWNGYDTVNKMRLYHYPRRMPYLVAFTASVHEQHHIIAHGFDDHLYKPVTMKALRDVLEKATLQRQSNTSSNAALA